MPEHGTPRDPAGKRDPDNRRGNPTPQEIQDRLRNPYVDASYYRAPPGEFSEVTGYFLKQGWRGLKGIFRLLSWPVRALLNRRSAGSAETSGDTPRYTKYRG